MPALKKINQVEEVAKKLTEAKSIALVQYQGLNAADISELRANIKQNGGVMEVVKNSLITRALAKIGIKLPETLTGPTSITYCNEDEVAPLKEIDKINKAKEITSFKYGIYDKKLLSLDELKTFINLPSKTTLISQFISGLVNPLQRLVYAMRFNQTQLVLTLKSLSEKQK
ncbi:MAG: 50S ribosomal protein L10 [Candidatus Shapirobacteria bacterium]|jgi:large subunit ribosomal protein L10